MTSDELQRVRRLMSEGSTEQYHPKAFISHATLDHPFVEKFAADLRANGVDAWFSKWEIKAGDSIRAKIEEGLEGAGAHDAEHVAEVRAGRHLDVLHDVAEHASAFQHTLLQHQQAVFQEDDEIGR